MVGEDKLKKFLTVDTTAHKNRVSFFSSALMTNFKMKYQI